METRTKVHTEFAHGENVSTYSSSEIDDYFSATICHPNSLIRESSPLLGFIIRVKSLIDVPKDKGLVDSIEQDLRQILQRLELEHYEPGILLSWSYFFCTFIDEMVMARPWGIESWAQHTLLVRFHSETWGGEKCFQLINRLLLEPSRYRDLLEFIHLCLCLGFQGRYRMTIQYQEEREKILRLVHQKLQTVSPQRPVESIVLLQNTVVHYGIANKGKKYGLRGLLSVKKIIWIMVLLALAGYFIFSWQLHIQTENIIFRLDELLP